MNGESFHAHSSFCTRGAQCSLKSVKQIRYQVSWVFLGCFSRTCVPLATVRQDILTACSGINALVWLWCAMLTSGLLQLMRWSGSAPRAPRASYDHVDLARLPTHPLSLLQLVLFVLQCFLLVSKSLCRSHLPRPKIFFVLVKVWEL